MSGRRRRTGRHGVWLVLADTMTLAAGVFLLLFLVSMLSLRDVFQRSAKTVVLQESRDSAKKALQELEKFGFPFNETDAYVEVPEGKLQFESARATLSQAGLEVIHEKLAPSIKKALEYPNHKILIAGHTDAVPYTGPFFASNWELSTARATRVLREVLAAEPGIPKDRVFAAGFESQHLKYPDDPTNPGNRRVEIMVWPDVKMLFGEGSE